MDEDELEDEWSGASKNRLLGKYDDEEEVAEERKKQTRFKIG